MIKTQLIKDTVSPFGIEITAEQGEKFNTYGKFLVEYNEKVNLTAITDPDEIAVKHFADCAIPLSLTEIKQGASIIDVGTGAGFPGVPLKIMRDDLKLTLLDSLNKRLIFLQQLSEKLGQQNELVHARAEMAGIDSKLREKYDYATSRAVAQLAVLCEYCLPLVKEGGTFLALKGADAQAEADAAAKAIKLLGGSLQQVKNYTLPDGDKRALLVIKKISQTPPKYPRPSAQISKAPL